LSEFLKLIADVWRFIVYKCTHAAEERWRTILACLLLSGTFWFLRSMNKEYTSTVAIKLKFQYNQSAWVPIDSLPTKIIANVSGSGWSVALLKIRPISPVLVYKANIEEGNLMLSPTMAKKQLIPLLFRTQVNYIIEDERTIRFDSIISLQATLPIRLIARVDSSLATAQVCIKGPSLRISNLLSQPTTRIPFEHSPIKNNETASVQIPAVLLLGQHQGVSLCKREETIPLTIRNLK